MNTLSLLLSSDNLVRLIDSSSSLCGSLISLLLSVLMIVSMWIIFKKSGRSGWECLIPIYNYYQLADMTTLNPTLWTILIFVPFANIVSLCYVFYKLGVAFGKGALFNIFLVILFPMVGLPILAFSSAEYKGY